jgi:hypothetical protein
VKRYGGLFCLPKLHLLILHDSPIRASRCNLGKKRYGECFLALTLVYTYQPTVHAEESIQYSLEMRCTEFLHEQIAGIPNFANYWNLIG